MIVGGRRHGTFLKWPQPGARKQEGSAALCSWHGVFTNMFIFRLNLPPIDQTPTEASLTNHKHELNDSSSPLFLSPNSFFQIN